MSESDLPRCGTKSNCVARLDRLRFACPRSGFKSVGKPPGVPGFKTIADTFVNAPKGKTVAYKRVRRMENPTTGTKIHVQHWRAHGYLKPMRVTVIGPDLTGILWAELKSIGDAFKDFVVRMVELAFDFSSESGVDADFVRRHARFGKSKSVPMMFPGYLRYGTRQSPKMIRCYWKKQVGAFRVEIEFHSTFPVLPQTDCLLYLLDVSPSGFSFVRVDWLALDAHLTKKGIRGMKISAEARTRYTSLQRLLRYLRRSGVNNPHRFLRTMKKDQLIREAAKTWSQSLSPRVRNKKEEVEDDGGED